MQKKFAEEQARLRAATSEAVGGVDRLRHVTAATATPYLVLSGNVKPGQISDPSSGYATSDRAVRTEHARLRPFASRELCQMSLGFALIVRMHLIVRLIVCHYVAVPAGIASAMPFSALRFHDVHCMQVSLTPVLGAQTPALGGGMTPLAGNRKVEAMLGIDRKAADREAMPPPAARAKQQR